MNVIKHLIGLSVAMLGKAPGEKLLNEWYALYKKHIDAGESQAMALQAVAQHIAESDDFSSMYPSYLEGELFARPFLRMALGEEPSDAVVAVAVELLNGGTTRAEMGVLAVRVLLEIAGQGADHPDYTAYGTFALRFANQVEVAQYYTVTKRWEDADDSVLVGVNEDRDSVVAAKAMIDGMTRPGKSFELTTNRDVFNGTMGDDTFSATEKTLNGSDRLDGGKGNDTLELSSATGSGDISIPNGAVVKNIETLSVNSDGGFRGDLGDWEGLQTVALDVVGDVDLEAGGATVTSESLGQSDKETTVEITDAGKVELGDVSAMAKVKIMGKGTESVTVEGGLTVDINSKDSPSLTLKSVTLDGVQDGLGDDKERYGKNEPAVEKTEDTAAVPAKNNLDSVPVHIYSKAIEELTVHNTNTTLLVQNDDDEEDMTELTATVHRFGVIDKGNKKYGKLCLTGIEDLTLQVYDDSNVRLASDQIKKVSVEGEGDLTLRVTKFEPAKAETEEKINPSTTLETLMLSNEGKLTLDAKGLSKLKTVDASEATGEVKVTNLGKSVMTYEGSKGKDVVSVAAFAEDGLTANLGDGDDTFTVANLKAGKSRVDGGEGTDTLVLKEKIGANLKGAGSAYLNFETITLEAGEGSGIYDLKGLDVDQLLVSGGSTSKITFKNAMSGTDLKVSSKAPDKTSNKSVATTAEVSYMLEDGDNDSVMVHLHTRGGKMDGKADLGIRNPKTHLTLTLDDEIEEMTVHSTADVTSKDVKRTDYYDRLSLSGSDGLEEVKITGDAHVYIKLVADSPSLKLIDATESSGGFSFRSNSKKNGGVEFHGSPGNDSFYTSGTALKDNLMGNGGDDLLIGGLGEDTLTGGAGGDALIGGQSTQYLEIPLIASLSFSRLDDGAKDTFVYNAASDSQVDLDKMSGFDSIFNFDADRDKIKLSPVLDLQGQVYYRTDGTPLYEGGGNIVSSTPYRIDHTKSLKQIVSDHGKGLFISEASGSSFSKSNSIVWLASTEKRSHFSVPYVIDNSARFADATNVESKWVLVDVDGDGDFDADTDMAIAIMDNNKHLDATDFI